MTKQVIDITVSTKGIHVRRGNNKTGHVQFRVYDVTPNRMNLLYTAWLNDNAIHTQYYTGERYLVEQFINRKSVNEKRYDDNR